MKWLVDIDFSIDFDIPGDPKVSRDSYVKQCVDCVEEGVYRGRIHARGLCSHHYHRFIKAKKAREETCTKSVCTRGVYARTLCHYHYNQWLVRRPELTCIIDGCDDVPYLGKLCGKHYLKNLYSVKDGKKIPVIGISSAVFWRREDVEYFMESFYPTEGVPVEYRGHLEVAEAKSFRVREWEEVIDHSPD